MGNCCPGDSTRGDDQQTLSRYSAQMAVDPIGSTTANQAGVQADSSTQDRPRLRPFCIVRPDDSIPGKVVVADVLETEQQTSHLMPQVVDSDKDPLSVMVLFDGGMILVKIKIVFLECCAKTLVWRYSTNGLEKYGQQEVVFIMEYNENEKTISFDMLEMFQNIAVQAKRGNTVSNMGFTHFLPCNFLKSNNHTGFLYVAPSFQCIRHLLDDVDILKIPLFMILIHQMEVPMLRNMPVRLMTRLGHSETCYPCGVVNKRNRPPVFVGVPQNSLLTQFADFEHFKFTFPRIENSHIIINDDLKVTVTIPYDKHQRVGQILDHWGSGNVFVIGGDFSLSVDTFLTVTQSLNGYQTTGITKYDSQRSGERTGIGANFIIFAGALKGEPSVKSALLEDGIMVMMRPEIFQDLAEAMRNRKGFTIRADEFQSPSEASNGVHSGKVIEIQWVDPKPYFVSLLAAIGLTVEQVKNRDRAQSITFEAASRLAEQGIEF
ncbi:zinc finger FYVE domain-containing protein 9-like isoform X2 [Tubulanus polymorphus]|uniref:zinc finger FYVE domain-containing protein 9-like isoform X2 n=1 Tax=Tubulanus polymorphus TaxID=672921 RepID=UPI003DA67310